MSKKYALNFHHRDKGFDPEFEQAYDAEYEFNKLSLNTGERKDSASEIMKAECQRLMSLDNDAIKKELLNIQNQIEKDVEKNFNEFCSPEDTADQSQDRFVDEGFLEKRLFDDLDLAIKGAVDKHILDLLPIIRTMLIRFNRIALFDVQLIAGVKLYRETILEIKTGEGKTFIIPIAAIFFGIRTKLLNRYYYRCMQNNDLVPEDRFQVHIVTANDYLARRDYTMLHRLYEFFQLSCYYIQDEDEYKQIPYYSYELVYCTCRQLCHLGLFDLRKKQSQLSYLPNFRYTAILDEVDQILLDEALTPHILSGSDAFMTYEIDIVYQAIHLAKKIVGDDTFFKFDKGRNAIGLTETGELFFAKLTINAFNEVSSEPAIYSAMREFLSRCIKSQNEKRERTVDSEVSDIVDDPDVAPFFIHFFEKLKDLFRIYTPFLLGIMRMINDKIYLRKEETLLRMDYLIKRYKNYSLKDFANALSKLVSTVDMDDCVRLLSFFNNYNSAISVDLHPQVVSFNRKIFRYLDDHFKEYETKWMSLNKALYLMHTADLPQLFKNNRLNIGVMEIPFEDTWHLLDVEADSLCLSKPMQELLSDEKAFVALIQSKIEKMDDLYRINIVETLQVLLKMGTLAEFFGVELIIESYMKRNLESNFPERKDVNLFLQNKLRAIQDRPKYAASIEAFENGFMAWKEEANNKFDNDIPLILQEFFLDLDGHFEVLTNISVNGLFLMKDSSGKNFQQIIAEKWQQFKCINTKKEYINFLSELFAIVLFRLFAASLSLAEKSKSNASIQNIFLIAIVTTLLFLEDRFGKDLLENYRTRLTTGVSDYLLRTDNDYIRSFFDQQIIKNIIIDYGMKHRKFEFVSHQVLYDIVKHVNSMEEKDALMAFLDRFPWVAEKPCYEISATDYLRKKTKLKHTARVISDYHFELLSHHRLAINFDNDRFFDLVQCAFNSVKFYENKIDYIVNTVDFENDPRKKKNDPYTRNDEDQEILIIDEITGRPLIHQRWLDNVHSSVEAKENLLVRGEWKSVAQITPQSLFGSYEYLLGLSGTTLIAEREFYRKYTLPVEVIPTNKPIKRKGLPDKFNYTRNGCLKQMMFDTLKICYTSQAPVMVVLENIKDCEEFYEGLNQLHHNIVKIKEAIQDFCHRNQIRLSDLGKDDRRIERVREIWNRVFRTTISMELFTGWQEIEDPSASPIEIFQRIPDRTKMLESLKIDEYTPVTLDPYFLSVCVEFLLNDNPAASPRVEILDGRPETLKNESEIIKVAGRPDSILVATRVTGRGTDIVLHKTKDREHPGLYILILNHQKSKRHDQQISGRCGRQGDIGHYRFYNCLESGWLKEEMASFFPDGPSSEDQRLFQPGSTIRFENLDQEFNFSQVLFSSISRYQMKFEESALRSRLAEKRIGDRVVEYQHRLTHIKFDQIFDENSQPALSSLVSTIPTKLKQMVRAGYRKSDDLGKKIYRRNISWIVDYAVFLTNLNYEQKKVEERILRVLTPPVLGLAPGNILSETRNAVRRILSAITDMKQGGGHKNNHHWELSDIEEDHIAELFERKLLERLVPTGQVSEKEADELSHIFEACGRSPHLEAVMTLIMDSVFHQSKCDGTEIYNRLIHFYQNKYGLQFNNRSILDEFVGNSEKLVLNLNIETCMTMFIIFKLFVSLFLSLKDAPVYCEEYSQSLTALGLVGIKFKGIAPGSETRHLLQTIVAHFSLPINWGELQKIGMSAHA